MAAGKRYKWQGSRIEFAIDFSADSPGVTITGVDLTNPVKIHATNTYEAGDVVKIADIVGTTELNDQVGIIINPTGGTFELAGVDATGYTAWVSGGEAMLATFSQMCELTGYNRQGGSSPEIDATTICSEATEYEVGLPDFGTSQLDYNFAPSTGIQQALEEFHEDGDVTAVRVILPKSGGTRVLLAFVQQTSEQASNGTLWKGSATLRNTGRPRDFFA